MLPKSVKNVTLEDLQKENISLYDQIFNLGKESLSSDYDMLNCKITSQEGQITKLNSNLKVLREGIKLKQIDLAESLIKEDKNETESISIIVKAASDIVSNSNKFSESAPPAAGHGSGNETLEIDTKEKAYELIKTRDKLTKMSEIVYKARREFSSLFLSKSISTKESK
jgi:uncharacterized protein YdaT